MCLIWGDGRWVCVGVVFLVCLVELGWYLEMVLCGKFFWKILSILCSVCSLVFFVLYNVGFVFCFYDGVFVFFGNYFDVMYCLYWFVFVDDCIVVGLWYWCFCCYVLEILV